MPFNNNEIAEYAAFAERLAVAARAQTLPRFRTGINVADKASDVPEEVFDPVTDADREAERAVRQMIEQTYPAHGVLGEEFPELKRDGPWRWVLDPVDGTRAFMCGTTSWTTLIALEYDGAPVIGLIDQPFTNERWLSFNGETNYSRDGKITRAKTSGLTTLAKARISTTDPLPTAYFSDAEAAAFARVHQAARVARYSLDAYAYGLLAIGEIDLVIEAGLKRFDYAALGPVVEAAGGVVTNWRGEPPGSDDRGELIAAATPQLHQTAIKLLAN